MLAADGELTRRYDAYRAAAAPPGPRAAGPAAAAARPPALTRVTLHWSDGTEASSARLPAHPRGWPPGRVAP